MVKSTPLLNNRSTDLILLRSAIRSIQCQKSDWSLLSALEYFLAKDISSNSNDLQNDTQNRLIPHKTKTNQITSHHITYFVHRYLYEYQFEYFGLNNTKWIVPCSAPHLTESVVYTSEQMCAMLKNMNTCSVMKLAINVIFTGPTSVATVCLCVPLSVNVLLKFIHATPQTLVIRRYSSLILCLNIFIDANESVPKPIKPVVETEFFMGKYSKIIAAGFIRTKLSGIYWITFSVAYFKFTFKQQDFLEIFVWWNW